MMDIASKTYWKRTLELAIRGGAMGALFVLAPTTGDLITSGSFNSFDADWRKVAGYALGGMILSLLFSLAAKSTGDPESPTIS